MSKITDTILFILLMATMLFSLTREEPLRHSRHAPETETPFTVYINGQEY